MCPVLPGKALETGQIDARKAGTHRRASFNDLLKYLDRALIETQQSAGELTALTQELGLGYRSHIATFRAAKCRRGIKDLHSSLLA